MQFIRPPQNLEEQEFQNWAGNQEENKDALFCKERKRKDKKLIYKLN